MTWSFYWKFSWEERTSGSGWGSAVLSYRLTARGLHLSQHVSGDRWRAPEAKRCHNFHKRRTFLLYSVAAWRILVDMKSFTSGYLQCASSQVLPGKCEIDRSLQVDCGQPSISPQECVNLGCCYDEQYSVCFYRLNGEISAHPMTSAWVEVKLRCSICIYIYFPCSLLSGWTLCVLCQGNRNRSAHRSQCSPS